MDAIGIQCVNLEAICKPDLYDYRNLLEKPRAAFLVN